MQSTGQTETLLSPLPGEVCNSNLSLWLLKSEISNMQAVTHTVLSCLGFVKQTTGGQLRSPGISNVVIMPWSISRPLECRTARFPIPMSPPQMKDCMRPKIPATNVPLNQTNSSQPTGPGRTLPTTFGPTGRHGEEGHLGQISSEKPGPPHPPKPLRHTVVMPSRSPGYTRHQRLSGSC